MHEQFARHTTGCPWCDANRPDFCAILHLFLASGGCTEEWMILRNKCIPVAADAVGGLHGMTVWQAVCRSEGITDLRGGRYATGGEVPSVDAVMTALLYSEVSRPRSSDPSP